MKLESLFGYLNTMSSGYYYDKKLSERLGCESNKYLEKYGYKVYSQNDEDGIISEIFKRIGTTNKKFIEFGVQDGLESNSHYLLLKGWSGLWIECDNNSCNKIKDGFHNILKEGRLYLIEEFINKKNINRLFERAGIQGEIDLLSIDIDGNDYHIWKRISVVNPRVVIIEYNAKFPPECEWVMPYNEEHVWDGSDKYGASLASLNKLGKEKGYTLVGTNIQGVNAFFVRNDLVADHFEINVSIDELYNPPRYFKQYFVGHPSKYCIASLSEGRGQIFDHNPNENIIGISGVHEKEYDPDSNSYFNWMSDKSAVFLIKYNSNVNRIFIKYDNRLLRDILQKDTFVTILIDDKKYKELYLSQDYGVIEIIISKCELINDYVIKLQLVLEDIVNLKKLGKSQDYRDLGLRINSIEIKVEG